MKTAVSKIFLAVLAVIACGALFADWIAPYHPNEEARKHSFHPPTKIHFDQAGPYILETEPFFDENLKRCYRELPERIFYIVPFKKGRLFSVEEPARIYLFGSDSRGRDLFSRILHGARVSLSIGLIGAMLSVAVGFLYGAAAGYYGGRVDLVMMRIAEFFIMVPGFYLLLAIRGALPPEMGSKEIYFMIVFILSLIGWGGIARVVRGMTVSLKENEFVPAARLLGRSDLDILLGHFLPHMRTYLLVLISISIPAYILGESALSLIGLGIQDPDVSWGSLLKEASSVAHIGLRPWVLIPGGVLFLVSLSLNVLSDSLRRETA